jgi:hypothetical protein
MVAVGTGVGPGVAQADRTNVIGRSNERRRCRVIIII